MGFYGGGSAPEPDPNIGIAALKSAKVGEKLLGWMQDQAKVTNRWAEQDRRRERNVFLPLQNEYIREAKNWDNPGRKQAAATQAIADTRQQSAMAQDAQERSAMAMGVNPASGRFRSAAAKAGVDSALAAVGAGNLARRQVEGEADARIANAINMGSGLAVNPATSMGLSNNALAAGGSGAMTGYGQQGQLLNTQYQQQMQSYQANQDSLGGFFSAAGTLGGMLWGSSKDFKTEKEALPEGSALGAIRDMPVESWRYRPGLFDGGKDAHVGPYAEDFKRVTGRGDGRTIPAQDAIGLVMGAMKDVDRELSSLKEMVANTNSNGKKRRTA